MSVDTWDRLFRWREEGELQDRTVEGTWERVAVAIARHGPEARAWASRYADAFRSWHLLPDARLLRSAGTSHRDLRIDSPRATLNLGSFVAFQQAAAPFFDWQLFKGTARLAVRMLDDSLLAFPPSGAPGMNIGIMGFADALAKLGIGYCDVRACEFAADIGITLSGACRGMSSELLLERGRYGGDAALPIAEAANRLQRHPQLTCVASQPNLAQFANQSSDALDPQTGSAWDLESRWSVAPATAPADPEQMLLQQIEVRARLQPWIDSPINYPLVYSGPPPDPQTLSLCRESAMDYGLPCPNFRKSELPIAGLG